MQDKLWDQIRSSKMSELEEESEDAEADFIAIRRLANSTADSAVNDRKALFEREFKKISKQPLIGPVLTSDKPSESLLYPILSYTLTDHRVQGVV